ncbi:SHQ1-like protein [Oryzias melastigma]|uniref:Protein SHQ1 homolog n=1 Tax=Oryzias melastigma TaxID=30732 RepID=A0A834CTQ4_ORYME|nr:SHQ1-like protein [Oryzias melastigma]
MITPAFELSQDPDFLILSARVPYTRTSEFDLFVDGTDLKFAAKPYFLRLTLPGRIVEDGREKATFDIDKGLFTLRIPKETAGEHFQGLQMLTSLLAQKGSRSAKPLVEDLSGAEGSGNAGGQEEDEEEFDWQIEQEVYKEKSEEELGLLQKYGFANQRCGVFHRLQEELCEVIDLKNPEGTSAAERTAGSAASRSLGLLLLTITCELWWADLFEDDEIKRLLKFRPWWTKLRVSPEQEEESAVSFSEEEREQLRRFTNRSYLLDKTSRRQAWLSLVDILLAFCYEVRSTEGEHSVESPWTIRKLSGTLSWLETYSSLQDVLVSFGRRVSCFPLYRHFALVTSAIRDTAKIFQQGKACVLKCLLEIHKVFRENEPAYILNDLYITDYCIWIQGVKSKKVESLATALQKVVLQKKDLELELNELESAAAMVLKEEEEEESSSSSASSSESDDSDDESCPETEEGGETCRDSPSQPPPSVCPIHHTPTDALLSEERSTLDALPSASEDCRQLIQELRLSPERRQSEPSDASADGGASGRSPGETGNITVETAEPPADVFIK